LLGTIVNTAAIIAGGLIGYFFKNLMPENHSESIMKGISLAIITIGFQMALKAENIILLIISMVIGVLIGENIDIEKKLDSLGELLERIFKKKDGNIGEGFVTATLMYCVGSMAIIGAIEGGMLGKHDVLFAKSVLDGIISIPLTAALGIGVIFSSIPVFLYQGSIVVLAGLVKNLMTDAMIADMSSVGGLLIMSLGLNVLIKERIKVGNMLPALTIPLIYHFLMKFF
jgi:uncharacterized membrane protein YqgA involved in biofilm formation